MILLIRVLKKLGLLRFFNLKVRVEDGIVVPLLGSTGIELLQKSELWHAKLLRQFLPRFRNAVFIDVGVNVGQTLVKVVALNRSQAYIGFEPNPACVHFVNALVKENRLTTFQIIPAALAIQSGITELYFYSDFTTDSSASTVSNFRENQTTKRWVPVVDGRSFQFTDRVGMIKIDVEGSEHTVLMALKSVVLRDRPLISCEVLPAYSRENTRRIENQNRIENFLNEVNYGMIRVHLNGHFEHIEAFGVYDSLDMSNYLFFPVEAREEIQQIIDA